MLPARHEHDAARFVIRPRTPFAARENLSHHTAQEVQARLDTAPAGELLDLHAGIVN